MRKLASVLLLALSITSAVGQEVNTTGDLKSIQQKGQNFDAVTQNTFIRIEVVTPSIIHIRADKKRLEDNFSYAVVGPAIKTAIRFMDSKDSAIIQTDSVELRIRKKPFRISFYTLDGKLINEDEDSFGLAWIGEEVTNYKRLLPDERFIGLGEKTGPLDRRGNGYTNWNTDCFGYGPDTDPLYSSIPFYIGIHDQMSYGIFLDNSSRTHFNFGASNTRFSSFTAETGEMDYYFIYHGSVAGILESYTYLTGRTPLPPRWSMGFQQCRWSYFPDKEVLNIAKTFREKQIPLDVLYLDIHYMDNYKIFSWNKDRFPDPAGMVGELKKMGIRTTLIIDPGIKVEKGYEAYEDGLQKNVFLKYPDNSLYEGSVWPGLCHFPDFTHQDARKWWGSSFRVYTDAGVEGFWNDMNEPATWGQRFPSLVNFDFDGQGGTTREGRNIYGMQMARSTYEGTKLLLNKRPFVLTRAGFAGLQRYTALWTGDNTATEDHMMLGVRLVNSLGLSGVANAGVDVGGFNGDATSSLYARWMTIGAFTPFFRAHKMINMKESEPWSYGEETESIVKHYIRLRYKLMPYVYSSFHENTKTGIPVSRSLAIEYTHEPRVYQHTYHHQYLFGEALMIAPVPSTHGFARVFLPAGPWYDFYNDTSYAGDEEIIADAPLYRLPVFVRGGSIIPMQSAVQSTSETPSDTLSVHVYRGDKKNTFAFYEDDGESFDFEKGIFAERLITFDPLNKEILFSNPKGNFQSQFKYIRVVLHGFGADSFMIDGVSVQVTDFQYSPVFPDSAYSNELYYAKRDVIHASTFIVENRGDIQITW